ncbi:NAD(P)-dependent oxidoreductase [candidate division KSB1 bacterium]|nr:NAD(P)-dependent oxidoreductase [candidate division KSB1 bacterium]
MKALVTGSNGFIGSALVERLLKNGIEVNCLVRRTSDLTYLQNLPVKLSYADLRDASTLRAVVEDIDMVYHLAGVTKARNREAYLQGNYVSTLNLLQACDQYSAADLKFVFVSSLAAAGPSSADKPLKETDAANPISVYGESKLRAEEAVVQYAKHHFASIIRPPVVYGPRDRDVFVYFKSVQKGLILLLGKGTQPVSLVHVDDLVEGILLASTTVANGKIYYISGDGTYNWQIIGRSIAAALAKKPLTLRVPLWLLKLTAFMSVSAAKLANKPALLNWDKVAEMKQAAWLCSNERAKKELGYKPQIDLSTGIQRTAAWYKSMGWL